MKLYLAENLKKLRKERDITQEDLAGFIGVSFQTVSKWERGEGYPDITILYKRIDFPTEIISAFLNFIKEQ